jgi:hypothetical protein
VKLTELLECAKPLLFEDGWQDYEYSGGGTFFLAKYERRFYGITAQHCLRGRDKNAIRLMLDEEAPSSEKFMQLRSVHELNDPDTGPEDYSDVALLRIDEAELTDGQRVSERFLKLDKIRNQRVLLDPGEKLVTRGFPNSLGAIDYDRRKIRVQALTFDGLYAGRTDASRVHRFQFSDSTGVTDLNGMSGSPVFVLRQTEQGLRYLFGGMIIQGSTTAGVARFIDCGTIFAALDKVHGKE